MRFTGALAIDACVAIVQIAGLAWLSSTGNLTVNRAYSVMAVACGGASLGWLLTSTQRLEFDRQAVPRHWKMNWTFGRWAVAAQMIGASEIREQWSEGGNRIRQIAAFGLGGFGLLCWFLPSDQRLRIEDPLCLLAVVYLAFITASYFWSIDPDATKRRLVVLGFFSLAVFGAARQIPLQYVPLICMLITWGYLILGVALEIALGTFTPWSGTHRFAGTTHPNIQASYLVTMCLATWAVHRQPVPWRSVALLILVAGLFFLLLTRSRTSAVGLVLAFIFASAVTGDKLKSFKYGYAANWVGGVTAILVLLSGSNIARSANYLLRMGRKEAAVEEAGSLTGRLPLWEELLVYAKEKPMTGYGYEAFWTVDNYAAIATEIEWGPAAAHSSFLECQLDLGYVGLGIMLTAIVLILWRLSGDCARTKDPGRMFVLSIFVFSLIFGLTEAGIRTPSASTFFLSLGLVSSLLFEKKSSLGDELQTFDSVANVG